jgi:predicted MFS family arabinose efflux permease
MAHSGKVALIAILGTAQTLAWASSYYLPAVLAQPMANALGISVPTVFAAFSAALIVTAITGPFVGKAIDNFGGRPILIASSLLFASGLALIGVAQHVAIFFLGWLVLGLAMACGLYEAAFAALVRLYGHQSRSAITGIALLGGLASTIGWPMSAWLDVELGWRGACLVWAALHLCVGLPLNLLLPTASAATEPVPVATPSTTSTTASTNNTAKATAPPQDARRIMVLLSFVFASTLFISTAMGAHLPRVLQNTGLTLAAAVGIAALVGPAQVAGRLLEFGILRRIHPLLSARLAAAAHPLGAIMLLLLGASFAPLFAMLHGFGNGILTIARGLLPLALFGPGGYGARQGWLMVPARITQAFTPVVFGLSLEHWGIHALWLSCGIGLLTLAALLMLKARPQSETR